MSLRILQHNERGTTYLDVMLAVFIAAMGCIATFGLLKTSSMAADSARCYSCAGRIARQEIEAVRASKGYMLSNRANAAFISAPSGLSELAGGTGKLTIADSPILAGAKDITATVQWQHPSGGTESVTLKTMVSSDGATK